LSQHVFGHPQTFVRADGTTAAFVGCIDVKDATAASMAFCNPAFCRGVDDHTSTCTAVGHYVQSLSQCSDVNDLYNGGSLCSGDIVSTDGGLTNGGRGELEFIETPLP